MVDVFSPAKRAAIMSRVRGQGGERTELALARIMRRHKISGWRRHQAVFGKPDFVFWRERLAVFVDGCFWHGCPKHGSLPESNRAFWARKLVQNRARDRFVRDALRKTGWNVLRIWQHELKPKNELRVVTRIRKRLARSGRKLKT
jgi:DNA mismatch endonuclease (patch repair protein)